MGYRAIRAQPTRERMAYFALLYGTGIEVSVGLQVRRTDIIDKEREIRALGTKAATRDRVVTVDEWAWETIWAVARTAIGMAPIFPRWNRWTVSDWHRDTISSLGFAVQYPLMNARHHWGATHARSGTPIHIIQRQLGHSSPQLTLSTYGLFCPDGTDRARYSTQHEAYEQRRVSANGGAR